MSDAGPDIAAGWSGPGAGPGPPHPHAERSPRAAAIKASATRVAGGLVFAAILWLFDLRLAAALVVVAVLVLSLISIVSPPTGEKINRAIVFITKPIGRVLATALLAVVYFIVVTPVSLLLRLVGRDLLESPTDSTSTWVIKPFAPNPSVARRQFTLEAGAALPGGRRRISTAVTLLLVTVGALVVLVAVDLGVGAAYGSLRGSGSDSRATLPAYDGSDWAAAYFEEFNDQTRSWEPFLGMVRHDYAGEYINVTDRARKSYAPEGLSADAASVYFFGGSTAWGTGQRDLYTIPSYLARLAEDDGVPVAVSNYGQSGWVIWQELALLQQLLSEGKVPDVAVFYNGFNDVGTQIQDQELDARPTYPRAAQLQEQLVAASSLPSSASNLVGLYVEKSMAARVVRFFRSDARGPDPTPALTEARARNAVDVHNRAVDVIESLAESYGFEVVLVWQPTAFTTVSGDAERFAGDDADGFGAAYRRSTELIGPPIIDLTNSLDDVAGPVFIDHGHTNEFGAEVVARALYPYLPLEMP